MSDRRMNVCNQFGVKTFPCHHCKASIGSLEILPTLLDTCLENMLMKYEQNRMVKNIQNFELFNRKPFLKLFLTKL